MAKKMTVLSLSLPIFFEIALRILMGSSNTLMLGHYSDSAVAAVGVSTQILNILVVMFGFVATGTGVVVAQQLGAKQKEQALEATVASLLMNLVFGLLLSLLMFCFADLFAKWMGLPKSLIPYAAIYMKVVGGTAFLDAVSLVAATVVRSFGYTKDAMFVTMGMNVLNIVGNYLVIFSPFGLPVLGVKGVAYAVVISKAIGLLAILVVLKRRVEGKLPLRSLKKFPKETMVNILRIGLPSAGENLSWTASQVVITSMISSLGTDVIAAKVYTETMIGYINIFSNSIAQGTQILLGHLIGAGKKEEAYKLCLKSHRLSFVCAFLCAGLLWLFCKPIFGLFTTNSTVLALASSLMILTLILEPGRTFNVVIISCLVAAGDAKFPFTMGIVSMWAISLGLSWLLGLHLGMGLTGVFLSYVADEWLRGVIMLWRWRSRKWQRIGPVFSISA